MACHTHLALELHGCSLQHNVLLLRRRQLLFHQPKLVGDIVHALGHGDGHPADEEAMAHVPPAPNAVLITTRNRQHGFLHSRETRDAA